MCYGKTEANELLLLQRDLGDEVIKIEDRSRSRKVKEVRNAGIAGL